MEQVSKIKRELEKTISSNDTRRALELLGSLESIPMTLEILQSTHIGKTVNKIRKALDDNEVGSLSKGMVKKWKKLLSSNLQTIPTTTTSSTSTSSKDPNNGNSQISYDSNSNSSPSSSSGLNNIVNNSSNIISGDHGSSHQQQDHSNTHSTALTPPISHQQQQQPPTTNNNNNNNNTLTSFNSIRDNKDDGSGGHEARNRKPAPVQTRVPTTNCEVRLKCRQLLCDALKKPITKELSGESLMEEEILAGRIEECIFQEFRVTDMKYKNRIRSRVSNLGDNKNPYLRFNVLRGYISPERIAKMTAEEMASDELKKEREKFTKEAINDHQMALTTGAKTSDIKCPACKKFNVTYNQVQTRSADEPMTTFCYCNECGKRWKFC